MIDFTNIKVLLIGDLMIDHYIYGESDRLSPEAPVPVIIPKRNQYFAGGAANVAMNLSHLGAKVTCIGVVGDDKYGKQLLDILRKNNICIDKIEILKSEITTLKQRIFCNERQITRIDYEKIFDWNPSIKFISNELKLNYDVVILSDYNKGVVNDSWLQFISCKDMIIDPKKDNFSIYKNAKIITPNMNELQKVFDFEINENSIQKACNQLISDYNFEYVIAKKGEKGITIVGKDNFIKNIKPHLVKNADVTGAGDTVISALSLFFHKEGDISKAAEFANYAAAISVSKKGTSFPRIGDLKNFFNKKSIDDKMEFDH